MKKKVIVLVTKLYESFWEKENIAPYPRQKKWILKDWDELANSLPLPGLGLYKNSSSPFCYLKITRMETIRREKNPFTPCFNFDLIEKSQTPSFF